MANIPSNRRTMRCARRQMKSGGRCSLQRVAQRNQCRHIYKSNRQRSNAWLHRVNNQCTYTSSTHCLVECRATSALVRQRHWLDHVGVQYRALARLRSSQPPHRLETLMQPDRRPSIGATTHTPMTIEQNGMHIHTPKQKTMRIRRARGRCGWRERERWRRERGDDADHRRDGARRRAQAGARRRRARAAVPTRGATRGRCARCARTRRRRHRPAATRGPRMPATATAPPAASAAARTAVAPPRPSPPHRSATPPLYKPPPPPPVNQKHTPTTTYYD
jgi:hypothetical protein